MLRVISGKYRGKKLIGPKEDNKNIRPTLDRVKEPLFSILMPYIENANFLDLFSGTGSIGIEALSRGAKFTWFNDMSKDAMHLISTNLSLTDTKNYAKITRKDFASCIRQIANENMTFDIIFLDPPYESNHEEEVLNMIMKENILSEDGIIILESDKRKQFNENIRGLFLKDKKTYGRVVLRIYIKEET